MTKTISYQGPHSAAEARLLARGQEMRQKADAVLADLSPSDHVQLDARGTNERLGTFRYTGSIGPEKHPSVQLWNREDGTPRGFVAENADGTYFKHDTPQTPATGLRAALATALSATGSGLVSGAMWLVAQGIMQQGQGHEIRANLLVAASKPLEFAGDLTSWVGRNVEDRGLKDQYYATSTESFLLSQNGHMTYTGPE